MTSMKNFTQVEVTGDADAVTSELYVENTIENPAWYTVEDNHVSLVSENIEKVIKLETDVLDDCIWESRIEITKYADNQSNMELPLESQFKLKFGLDRHIQKHHNSMCTTSVSTAMHTNIPNNDIISYPRQTKIITNTLERNSSNQIENQLASTVTYTNIPNNHIISYPRQTKIISNTLEIAIPGKYPVNSNESTLANEPGDLMAEQFPINTANNNIESIIRDTPYFCIIKSLNIENGFCNDDYDQTSENKLIFTCKICKNQPSTDIHSFALHMSEHRECNMHECIVCDKKFNYIGLWTAHMTYHQQQIDLNMSTVQFNLLEKESNTFDTNNENNKLEPNVIQNSTKPTNEHENNLSVPVNNKNNNLNYRVNKSNEKKSTFCTVCNKHFGHLGALTNHMRIHIKHHCDMCEKKFSTPFQLNVHQKSHPKAKIKSISHGEKIKCRYCKKECDSISQWKNHMSMSKECRRHCKSYLPEFTSNKTVLNKTYLNTRDNTGSQKDKLMDVIHQKPAIKKQNKINHINGAKCDLCGKIYSSINYLKKHISMIHKQTYEPMTCSFCGITFKHKFSYESHLRNKHKQLSKHYEGTNSTYKRTSGQIISVNKKNSMKYICEICKMKFDDNITLQKHTKIHTLNTYKCNDCGQQYETNLALSNHVWENHSAI
eukprot:XP_016661702.1 PREDICTED: zinc finger protein 62 homolog [Acyrthosiphon pisum]